MGDHDAPQDFLTTILHLWFYLIKAAIAPGFIVALVAWGGVETWEAAALGAMALYTLELKRVAPEWLIDD